MNQDFFCNICVKFLSTQDVICFNCRYKNQKIKIKCNICNSLLYNKKYVYLKGKEKQIACGRCYDIHVIGNKCKTQLCIFCCCGYDPKFMHEYRNLKGFYRLFACEDCHNSKILHKEEEKD